MDYDTELNELQDNIITVGVKRFRCTEVLSRQHSCTSDAGYPYGVNPATAETACLRIHMNLNDCVHVRR